MIYYIAAIIGTLIGACLVGELGFELPDPFVPVEERI